MYIRVHLRQQIPDIYVSRKYFNQKQQNNYKMNLANYQVRSQKKQKQQRSLIRSPAFRKKFEDGMPRINHKAIPFHNLYDIQITNLDIAQQHGLKFWGCVLPQKRKFKIKSRNSTEQKRPLQTRGENIFKNYMRRRPSLNLTPRSYDFDAIQNDPKYQSITEFQPQKTNHTHQQMEFRPKKQQQDSFLLTTDQISAINKKSLYEMTPHELEISIQWKKRFLQTFERRIKEVSKMQKKYKSQRF